MRFARPVRIFFYLLNNFFTLVFVNSKVTVEQGQALANQLGCGFVECSALRNERVEEAFLKIIARIENEPDNVTTDSNNSANGNGCRIM